MKPGSVQALASRNAAAIREIRHHLHAHPELSFREEKTAAFISGILQEWNIPHQTGVGGFGICGVLTGNSGGMKCIALRADMDALPITEKNNVSYVSQNPGVMHACGHDVHSAALLGALRILNDLRTEWPGSVKFIFQPAEEMLPGGASLMIRDGALENPRPDVILGQHVFTPLPAGTAGFRRGMYMASADEIHITVTGKGGHAADPHLVLNPLFPAAHLLVELEELIAELSVATVPTVLSFGKISGTGATNVIPDSVTIEGTLRTLDETWRKSIHDRLEKRVSEFRLPAGFTADLRIDVGYPCLINHEELTAGAEKFAAEYLGKSNVRALDVRMASEDFAFYSQEVPACFYRIGTGNPAKGITAGVHTPVFDIDEEALETAAGLMAWLTIRLLGDETG